MSEWIPLVDYAVKTGVSLSTLRRHIKANKVQYKVENGRYLLHFEGSSDHSSLVSGESQDSAQAAMDPTLQQGLQTKLQKLERDLQKAQEEIAELKTLIALYEEKIPPQRLLDS